MLSGDARGALVRARVGGGARLPQRTRAASAAGATRARRRSAGADQIRLRRARRPQAIAAAGDPAAGARTAARLIRDGHGDEALRGLTLHRILTAIPHVAPARAALLLDALGVTATLPLAALSARRAGLPAARLTGAVDRVVPGARRPPRPG